ncbi:MAG: hypothetical protein AB7O49_16545 [Sphingomonadales bacterium]
MDPSVARIAGVTAMLVAAGYVASSIAAALMPTELQGDPAITPHQFWLVLSANPTAHLAYHWCWVFVGLTGLGVVPGVYQMTRQAGQGWASWGAGLGFLGFAVNARSHLMEVSFDRKIIPIYSEADPATQQAVQVVAGLALDVPDGFLTYGAMGAWVLITTLLARRVAGFPTFLRYLGLAAAASFLLGLIAYLLLNQLLLVIAIGLGGLILVPAWFTLLGLYLLRASNRPSQQCEATP